MTAPTLVQMLHNSNRGKVTGPRFYYFEVSPLDIISIRDGEMKAVATRRLYLRLNESKTQALKNCK